LGAWRDAQGGVGAEIEERPVDAPLAERVGAVADEDRMAALSLAKRAVDEQTVDRPRVRLVPRRSLERGGVELEGAIAAAHDVQVVGMRRDEPPPMGRIHLVHGHPRFSSPRRDRDGLDPPVGVPIAFLAVERRALPIVELEDHSGDAPAAGRRHIEHAAVARGRSVREGERTVGEEGGADGDEAQ